MGTFKFGEADPVLDIYIDISGQFALSEKKRLTRVITFIKKLNISCVVTCRIWVPLISQ